MFSQIKNWAWMALLTIIVITTGCSSTMAGPVFPGPSDAGVILVPNEDTMWTIDEGVVVIFEMLAPIPITDYQVFILSSDGQEVDSFVLSDSQIQELDSGKISFHWITPTESGIYCMYIQGLTGSVVVSTTAQQEFNVYRIKKVLADALQITTDFNWQYSPAVSGDNVVWWDERNGNDDVYMYNIPTGITTQITPEGHILGAPSISGDIIVWADVYGNIHMYNIATSIDTVIAVDVNNPYGSVAVSEDRIVWQDNQGNIYMYYIPTGSTTQIITDIEIQFSLVISGDNIVLVEDPNANGYFDVYVHNIPTSAETVVTIDSASPNVAISGNKVAWSKHHSSWDWDICVYDIATGVTTQVTIDGNFQSDPAISGNIVVWTDYRNNNSTIYMYNIATGITTQITTGISDQYCPDISGTIIVWQDNTDWWDVDLNIYMKDLGAFVFEYTL